MNKYKRYRERRDTRIVASLKQRLGADTQLPQTHRQFTLLNKIKDPDEQAQVWARIVPDQGEGDRLPDGSTEGSGSVPPKRSRIAPNLDCLHPKELPRKLKIATALFVLQRLGQAYHAITEHGDDDEILMLKRVLTICRDQRPDEMQDALNALV